MYAHSTYTQISDFGIWMTLYMAVTKEKKTTLNVNRVIRVPFLSDEDEYFSISSCSSCSQPG